MNRVLDQLINYVEVRPGLPEDAKAIWSIEKESWLETYSNNELGITKDVLLEYLQGKRGELNQIKIEQWRDKLDPATEEISFVAVYQEHIVGFIAPFIEKTGAHRLGTLHLDPRYKRKGIGSKLLKASLEWHQNNDVYLYLVAYNHGAFRFYEKHGFTVTERGYATDVKLPQGLLIPNMRMLRRAQL